MKRRVIFVSSVFDDVGTGPGIYAQYLWEAFRDDSEIEFHLVVPSAGVRHERLHRAGLGKNSFETYRHIQRVAREIAHESGGIAIVHGNAAHSMSYFIDYPGPLVVQVNDYEAAEIWRRPWEVATTRGARRLGSLAWRHWQEKRVINAATRVIVNSSFTQDRLRSTYGQACALKCMRIYKAVDTAGLLSSGERHDPFPDRPHGARIVFIGSDWRRKGLADLLMALKLVSANIPNVHLTVGGPSDTEQINEIRALIDDNRLSRNVTLAGRVTRENLLGLHRHSDVFVLPSHEEAFGVALLEAMATGLPVVAADVGGMREIVSDGENGLTFPAGDAEQLAGAVETLLRDSSLRDRFRARGYQTAERFDVKTMVSSVREMYRLVHREFVESAA